MISYVRSQTILSRKEGDTSLKKITTNAYETFSKSVQELQGRGRVSTQTASDNGNALLIKGKHAQAYAKYTEAIGLASGKALAVLYCNRAQACLLLNRYGSHGHHLSTCLLTRFRWEDAKYNAADALLADEDYHKA